MGWESCGDGYQAWTSLWVRSCGAHVVEGNNGHRNLMLETCNGYRDLLFAALENAGQETISGLTERVCF